MSFSDNFGKLWRFITNHPHCHNIPSANYKAAVQEITSYFMEINPKQSHQKKLNIIPT